MVNSRCTSTPGRRRPRIPLPKVSLRILDSLNLWERRWRPGRRPARPTGGSNGGHPLQAHGFP
ncbi:hypothetical protein Rumeso_00717 [Rubellimicrobium mesophilum DSM 19309]|uniref:Uncharacterized protein n=1 Tax=Rubellimicrobium mesophilum DSM 19309 TaxID=442562 RepID=A0A017HT72_9RHOB|nr:hypothetical protein Rumeso_00717 [Rubellimicrobium mesophilum DSM 19309]